MGTNPHILLYTQPGCISCDLMRIYLEARELTWEERDITTNAEARRIMTEDLDSDQTPTVVILGGESPEVVVGFDPARLDQLLDPAPSSDAVPES